MWKKRITAILSLLLLTGCTATVTENNLSKVHFVKSEQEMGDKTPEERAATIKGRLRQIDGISGNAVVVEGHTAIIGLRLQDGMEKDASRLSKEADQAARATDAYIESTSITTNGHIVALIEDMERKRAG